MSKVLVEIICPNCGSPQIDIYEHPMICICLECQHSDIIEKFEYFIENE